MRITDEMVEAACRSWNSLHVGVVSERMRAALEAALSAVPQGFCARTQNCRLTDGHNGGCERS